MSSRSLLLGGVCILGLHSGNLHAQSITLDLRSTTPDSGYVGNCIHLEGECVKLTVSAWSYGADGVRGHDEFAEAALGQWSTGLGVLTQNELNRRTQYDHQLDNVREADFVLFLFDTPVRLLDLIVDPYGSWDTDVMYWSGMIDTIIDLAGASMHDLAEAGLQSTIDAGSPGSTPRTIIFSEHAFVNALLVGVPPASDAPDRQRDGFKIQQMNVACAMPEPSSLGLLLVGTAMLLLRRHR
jgi:hypothetical protein